MMPSTAGEITTSTAPAWALIFSASALQSRSVRSACMNTRFFCRNTGLCRPDDSTKWPSRRAPAARNSSSTSSVVMGSAPEASTPFAPGEGGSTSLGSANASGFRAFHGLDRRAGAQGGGDIGQVARVAHLDVEIDVDEIGLPVVDAQADDVAPRLADDGAGQAQDARRIACGGAQ